MGTWRQKMIRKQKEVNSVFGADITEALGISVSKKATDIHYGYGKKNPNAQKGRERRGKKKRK
jgi:RNA-binding protein NOB1